MWVLPVILLSMIEGRIASPFSDPLITPPPTVLAPQRRAFGTVAAGLDAVGLFLAESIAGECKL
jgi:hypothetical protein